MFEGGLAVDEFVVEAGLPEGAAVVDVGCVAVANPCDHDEGFICSDYLPKCWCWFDQAVQPEYEVYVFGHNYKGVQRYAWEPLG